MAIRLAARCRCGYKVDGLILPQFVPTNGRWHTPNWLFLSPGAPEPMLSPNQAAKVLRSGVAIATLLVWAGGSVGTALAQSSRSAAKTFNLNPAKQHDQELDSIRAEQRKSSE